MSTRGTLHTICHALSSVLILVGLGAARSNAAPAELVSWGMQVVNSSWSEEHFAEVATGLVHTLARRSDGSVVAWGWNSSRQCDIPALPPGIRYVEIAGG